MHKFQTFLFRRRGALMAVVAMFTLAHAKPTPVSLIAGLILAIMGEGLRFWSIGHSGGHTRGLEVEGPFLATGGPYAHCRNPLYVGNVLNSLGVALASVGGCGLNKGSALLALAVVSLSIVYGGIIPLEEKHLSSLFPEAFERYRREVPRFIPSLRAAGARQSSFCLDSALYYERWTAAWWSLIWIYLTYRTLVG